METFVEGPATLNLKHSSFAIHWLHISQIKKKGLSSVLCVFTVTGNTQVFNDSLALGAQFYSGKSRLIMQLRHSDVCALTVARFMMSEWYEQWFIKGGSQSSLTASNHSSIYLVRKSWIMTYPRIKAHTIRSICQFLTIRDGAISSCKNKVRLK